MKRFIITKCLGIVGVIILIFVSNYWPLPIIADGNEITGSKVSGLLSMHIKLKNEQSKNTALTTMRPFGVDSPSISENTLVSKERVFLHFAEQPTTTQINELNSLGVTVFSDSWIPPVNNFHTGFILADMPVNKLDSLASKSYIVTMDTAEQDFSPQNDQARTAMNVDPVWSGNYTGAGVTVAVIDSGLDTSNPDFPIPVATIDYSNYPNKDYTISNTITGHGTHVTGSLLGRGVHSVTYKGVAPGADLVFIKVSNDSNGAASSDAVIYAIRDAVDIYHARIINLSYGNWSQYHDGTDQACQAVDYAANKGTTVFVAAGNNGDKSWHYSDTVNANSSIKDIPVYLPSGTNSSLPLNLVWFDGLGIHNNLCLQYYSSNHTSLASLSSGQSESIRGTESNLFQLTGTYLGYCYLTIQNNSPNNQFFHLYYIGGLTSIALWGPDSGYTITSPAESDSAIAVGANVNRQNWTNFKGSSYALDYIERLGYPAEFSSRGPRVDIGSPEKPNVVAPGAVIISARDPLYTFGGSTGGTPNDPAIIDDDGQNLNGSGPANYFVMEGTSMASSMAAGVGALLLSRDPLLTPIQIKHLLSLTGKDSPSGYDRRWGRGLINAYLATNSHTNLHSYDNSSHTSATENFGRYSTQHTVYLYGVEFIRDYAYRVVYYDGANHKVAVNDVRSSTYPDVSAYPTLTWPLADYHTFVPGTDTAGTWHVIVTEPSCTPPVIYNANWINTIVSISFTVQNSAITPGYPEVDTVAASNITTTSAVLNGNLGIKGNAGSVAVSFDYGLSSNYGYSVLGNPATLSSAGNFSAVVTGLETGKTYHFRARADGGADKTDFGEDMIFSPWSTPLNGKIAFSTNRDGNLEIYTMNADTTLQTRITNNPSDDIQPSWSPDGSKIVFQSWRDGRCDIYVMNSDGSNVTRLTHNLASYNSLPVWSPDGTKIAFVGIDNAAENIFMMNADGSNPVRLTNSSYNRCTQPSWSPDGGKIIFTTISDTNHIAIFSINDDGSNQVCLTNIPYDGANPTWSPDRTKIAFVTPHNNFNQIFTMNNDGTNVMRLTSDNHSYDTPVWSPDGTKIAFSSYSDDPHAIWVMNADGTNQVKLSDGIFRYLSWTSSDSLVFVTPTQTIIAGSVSTIITIQARDASNTPINVYSDTEINLFSTSNSGRFDTSAAGSFNGTITKITIPAGNSSASFYYKDTATGTPTITAASIGLASGTQQETITVRIATKLAFTTQPAGAVAGVPFIAQPAVTIQDAGGNTVTNSIASVILTITSGTGTDSAVLSGTIMISAVNGVATFSGLSIDKVGTEYTLTASSGSLTPSTSQAFNVTIVPEAEVNISVGLQGSSRPDSGWVIPLTLKLFITGNTTPVDVLTATPISTFNLITARSGNITASAQILEVIPGAYDITVTSPHCLTNVKRGIMITAPSNTINLGTLLEGNANDDNKINIQDFGILAGTYGKSSGDTGFDARADFDRSNKISITDFGLLAANYGKYSAIEVP
jgi:Tol biopolymer transport system component/subtilisin family serine protease